MEQLTLTPYLDSERRSVLASEITEAMAVAIRKWPLQSSSVYPGDFLVLDHKGRLVVVSEAVFIQYYTKPETRSLRQLIHSRTWYVEIEIDGVRSVEKYVATNRENNYEAVVEHYKMLGSRIKVLSANRA